VSGLKVAVSHDMQPLLAVALLEAHLASPDVGRQAAAIRGPHITEVVMGARLEQAEARQRGADVDILDGGLGGDGQARKEGRQDEAC
jgi:hypothetical protein